MLDPVVIAAAGLFWIIVLLGLILPRRGWRMIVVRERAKSERRQPYRRAIYPGQRAVISANRSGEITVVREGTSPIGLRCVNINGSSVYTTSPTLTTNLALYGPDTYRVDLMITPENIGETVDVFVNGVALEHFVITQTSTKRISFAAFFRRSDGGWDFEVRPSSRCTCQMRG